MSADEKRSPSPFVCSPDERLPVVNGTLEGRVKNEKVTTGNIILVRDIKSLRSLCEIHWNLIEKSDFGEFQSGSA